MTKKVNKKKTVTIIESESENLINVLENLKKKPLDEKLLQEKNLLFGKLLKKLEVSPQKFSCLPTKLKSSKEFVLLCPKRSLRGELPHLGDNLKDDEGVVLECLKNENEFIHASDRLRNDMNFIKIIAQEKELRSQFLHIPKVMKNDKNFIMELMIVAPKIYPYLPMKLQDDKDIALASMKNSYGRITITSKKLLNDRDFIVEACKYHSDDNFLQSLPEYFREDRDVCINSVSNLGHYLRYFPKFQNDKDVLLHAIKSPSGCFLINIPEELLDDDDIIVEMMKKDLIRAFQNRSHTNLTKFLNNEELMSEVISNQRKYFKDYRFIIENNIKLAILACRSNSDNYGLLSKELQNNREIAMAAIECNGRCIASIASKFRNDEKIALIALKSFPRGFSYLSNELQMNRNFIIQAVSINTLVMSVMNHYPFGSSRRKCHPLAFDKEIQWNSKMYYKLIRDVYPVFNINFVFKNEI